MYKKSLQGWLKHVDFMVLDIICLQMAFILACLIRHGFHNPYSEPIYLNLAFIATLLDIIIAIFFEQFKNVLKRGYYKEFVATFKHVCLVVLLSAFYLFTVQAGSEFSRITLFLMGAFYALISYVVRVTWKTYLKGKSINGGKRSLLIVTSDDMMDQVIDDIQKYNYEMFRIAGIAVVNNDLTGKIVKGIEVVANRKTVTNYVCREWIDEVFIAISNNEIMYQDLTEYFVEMGVVVHINIMKSDYNNCSKKQLVEKLGPYTVLTTSIRYASAKELFLKRILDIIGGSIGCFITAVLFVFLAPIIYIQSPGPIFFSQTRVGKNGKKFKIYKFRSMYLDAEKRKQELLEKNRVKDGMMFKLDFDPRIIGCRKLQKGRIKKGIGGIIRDFSLDEFPQFFNVLRGDMSLVGTRPPTLDEWEKYEFRHRTRLAAKPGITGIWQISGRSTITDFEEVVKLDNKYISEWSVGLDIKIILKTIVVVFKREGAM